MSSLYPTSLELANISALIRQHVLRPEDDATVEDIGHELVMGGYSHDVLLEACTYLLREVDKRQKLWRMMAGENATYRRIYEQTIQVSQLQQMMEAAITDLHD